MSPTNSPNGLQSRTSISVLRHQVPTLLRSLPCFRPQSQSRRNVHFLVTFFQSNGRPRWRVSIVGGLRRAHLKILRGTVRESFLPTSANLEASGPYVIHRRISLNITSHLLFEESLVLKAAFLLTVGVLVTTADFVNRRLCRECEAC